MRKYGLCPSNQETELPSGHRERSELLFLEAGPWGCQKHFVFSWQGNRWPSLHRVDKLPKRTLKGPRLRHVPVAPYHLLCFPGHLSGCKEKGSGPQWTKYIPEQLGTGLGGRVCPCLFSSKAEVGVLAGRIPSLRCR